VLKEKNILLSENFILAEVEDWSSYLGEGRKGKDNGLFKEHLHTGWPLGNKDFIDKLEKVTRRILRRRKPGAKKKN